MSRILRLILITGLGLVLVALFIFALPSIAARDTSPETDTVVDTLDDVFNNDNSQIAFVSNRDGNNEIYVIAADGTNVVRLTNDPAEDTSPTWSPDGSKIAFASDRDGNNEIYVMAADGSNQINLTSSQADEAWPEWSPDGNKIVYYSLDHSSFTIYTMDADGSNHNELYSGLLSFIVVPSWSPNGTQLAMECLGEGSNPPDICVMDADGTNVSHLPNSTGGNRPTWSPDGSKIAFERDADIYAIYADGSSPTNLTTSQADEFWPEWSPRGNKIAYERLINGTLHICIMDADGSHQGVLVDQGISWCCPHAYTWSPDGSQIAYVENLENAEIFTVLLDEGVPKNLTSHTADDGDPAWQPWLFSRVYLPLIIRMANDTERALQPLNEVLYEKAEPSGTMDCTSLQNACYLQDALVRVR